MDEETRTPYEFIQNFRRHNYGIDENGRQRPEFGYLARQLTQAIEQLSKGLYSKDIHFVLELIQNAEDNDYSVDAPELEFVLLDTDPTDTPGSEGCLCIFNNEIGFEEIHVESICGIGQSTKKKRAGYIGEKGIGFKSVFVVSARPHIFSNGFQFAFRERDPDIGLAYVVPYWVSNTPAEVEKRRTTTSILLPLKRGKRAEIDTELAKIAPETILFLSRLAGITIESPDIGRLELIRDSRQQYVFDLLVNRSEETQSLSSYWVHQNAFEVPDDVIEEKREGIATRSVAIAFPLSAVESPGRVFAYLPTEVHTGLPFLINADFLLPASRETIQTDRKWNQWLRDSLATVVVAGIRNMLRHDDYKYQALSFVPLGKQLTGLKEFFAPVCEEVVKALSDRSVVLSDVEELIAPNVARLASRPLRRLFPVGDRPLAFEDFQFCHPKLEGYRPQLAAIGVKDPSAEDLRKCFSDIEWIQRQHQDWFINALSLLKGIPQQKRQWLDSVPIVPTEDSAWVAASSGVYLASDKEEHDRLIGLIENGGLPPVNFLPSSVWKTVEKSEELRAFVRGELGVSDFSLGAYLSKTLIPWMDQSADELSGETVLEVTRFLVSVWGTLKDAERESIGRALPVVVDSGRTCRRSALEGTELVFPRAFDPDLGWQLVFPEEGEMQHSDVLSDRYVGIGQDRDVVFKFLSDLGATNLPDPKKLKMHYRQSTDGPLEDYWRLAFAHQTGSWSQPPHVETLAPPSIVLDPKLASTPMKRNRHALVAWIEGMLEYGERQLRYGRVKWFYYSPQQRLIPSAVSWALSQHPWLPTSMGPRSPGECFVPSKQLKEMFGNTLPIIQDSISEDVSKFLGIQMEVTSETVVAFLKALSEHEPELSQVVHLYEYLEKYGKEFKEAFENGSLIYLPGSRKGWHRTSEVVWDDLSSIFGDLYPALSTAYESKNLRSFFIKKLGVAVSVEAEQLGQAWLRLSSLPGPEPKGVEAALGRIMPALLLTANGEEALPSWWSDFAESVEVWTHDRVFMEPKTTFAGDDDVLRRKFQDHEYFVWKPESRSHQEMLPLYRALGIPLISEAVDVRLDSLSDIKTKPKAAVVTELSKKLICYYAFSESAEAFDELLHSGPLQGFLALSEAETSQLAVVYHIGEDGAEVPDDDRYAFLDLEGGQLILKSGDFLDEWLDETADSISKLLWGRKWRSHADTVRTLLTVTGESRYSKLRQKRGWRMPRSLSKEIESLLGSPEREARGSVDDGRTADPDGDSAQATSGGDRGPDADMATSGQEQDGTSEGSPTPAGATELGTRQLGSRRHSEGQGGGRRGRGEAARGSTSGARSSIQPTRGRSRSSEITRRINQVRQSRLITYVVGEDALTEEERAQDEESYTRNKALGDAAEELVVQYEIQAGRAAERMTPNFPGYDIRSVDEGTGEVRFIEVKGQAGVWGARGVGLTARQFQEAKEKLESYWLYVVENVRGPNPQITRIRNPATRVTEFRFDEGWRHLAETQPESDVLDTGFSSELEQLKSLVTVDKCIEFIAFCSREDLEFPDVGFELMDNTGRVVAEAELAWPSTRVAIVLTTQDDDRKQFESHGWTVFLSSADIEEIRPLVRPASDTND